MVCPLPWQLFYASNCLFKFVMVETDKNMTVPWKWLGRVSLNQEKNLQMNFAILHFFISISIAVHFNWLCSNVIQFQ
jgi:hypothetical protein